MVGFAPARLAPATGLLLPWGLQVFAARAVAVALFGSGAVGADDDVSWPVFAVEVTIAAVPLGPGPVRADLNIGGAALAVLRTLAVIRRRGRPR